MAIASLALVFATALPAWQENPPPPETWEALADDYELSFMAWAQEMSRSGAWARPEPERAASPAASFWPRFATLAHAGEGRAVLWMLKNPYGEGDERNARMHEVFELVRGAERAGWVAQALLALGEHHEGLDDQELVEYVTTMHAPPSAHADDETVPAELRVSALLAHAALVRSTAPELAADLCQRAAFLRWRDVDLAPGEEVLTEDLREVATEAVAQVKHDGGSWFQEAFREGDDGVYYPRAAFPADPRETWRPVLEVLAERDATAARKWVLFNTWPRDERQREMLRTHLDVLANEGLEPDDLGQLAFRVDSFASILGSDFVEPRVRMLLDKAPAELQPALLFGLGDGLCETAGSNDGQRERGLALLREVQERWPASDQAKRAKGKLFRHENLVVGKPFPDFETVDVDGNAFKLSDYRGKVTVVDFWGFW